MELIKHVPTFSEYLHGKPHLSIKTSLAGRWRAARGVALSKVAPSHPPRCRRTPSLRRRTRVATTALSSSALSATLPASTYPTSVSASAATASALPCTGCLRQQDSRLVRRGRGAPRHTPAAPRPHLGRTLAAPWPRLGGTSAAPLSAVARGRRASPLPSRLPHAPRLRRRAVDAAPQRCPTGPCAPPRKARTHTPIRRVPTPGVGRPCRRELRARLSARGGRGL